MRPIAISLSPNAENEDVKAALKFFFNPLRVVRDSSVKKLEQWFRNYFNCSFSISFASGRGALVAILHALDIKKDDEVILQSFTCVAVPSAVMATGAMPVYADTDNTLTLNPSDVSNKITKKTKAIIVQHTFGIPTDMEKILALAEKYNLYVIEDCAHTIGGEFRNKKLGTIGDVSFFSFGRDKAFSSVFGGMAITNNKTIGQRLVTFQNKLSFPDFFWTLQQLFHPIAFFLILPIYNFLNLGKILLVFLQKTHLLSFPVSGSEKKGAVEKKLIQKLPNALAALALLQLSKIKEFNQTREKIGEYYGKELKKLNIETAYSDKIPFLRFPIFVKDPKMLIAYFKRHGIYLGNWYHNVIDPKGTDFSLINYRMSSCPSAEKYSLRVVNLPCYPTLKMPDAQKVIDVLKAYVKSN